MANELLWLDFLALKLIVRHYEQYGVAPVMDELYDSKGHIGMVNDFLREANVPREYVRLEYGVVRSQTTVDAVVRRLRAAGMIAPKIAMTPTELGMMVANELPQDWHDWPESVPVENGTIKWKEGNYVPLH